MRVDLDENTETISASAADTLDDVGYDADAPGGVDAVAVGATVNVGVQD